MAAGGNVTTTNTTYGNSTNSASLSNSAFRGDTVRFAANVTAFLSNGFTLNWSTVYSTTTPNVHYLALGGTDISVAGGTITPRTTTGSQSVTGLSFQPKLVLFLGSIAAAGTFTTSTSFGAAASSTGKWTIGQSAAATVTMAASALASSIQSTSACFSLLAAGGATTLFESIDFTAFTADGFTLNWLTASATAHNLAYIAFGGAATFSCGSFTKQANTSQTSQVVSAGLAVAPAAYILASSGGTTNTAQTTGWDFSIGGTDGGRANSVSWENRAGVIATQARSYSDAGGAMNSALRVRALPASATVSGAVTLELDHTSFNADGFTVALSTNTLAVASIIPYITFGPAAVSMPSTALAGPVDAFN